MTVEGPDIRLALPAGFTDHGEENGLRIRSHFDSYWGGRRYVVVDLEERRQLPGQYMNEERARRAAREEPRP
jgi:hypothetical protein